MQGNNRKRSRAFWAQGFVALWAVLGLGLSARSAEADPFAYVTRFRGNSIAGVTLRVRIGPTGTKRFALEAEASDANLKGTKNPVTVRVSIGNNSGTTSVKADIDRDRNRPSARR